MSNTFTKKQKKVMDEVSADIHGILDGLSHKDKKVLLRAVEKLNWANCWWFTFSLKDTMSHYLKNYFLGYMLDKEMQEESE